MLIPTLPVSCLLTRIPGCRISAGVVACPRPGAHHALSRGGTPAATLGGGLNWQKHLSAFQPCPTPPAGHSRRRAGAVAASAAAAASGDQPSGSSSSASGISSGGAAGSWPPPLEEWLRSHGGTVNGVELRTVLFPSGAVDRQLLASADLPAGQLIISVPRMLQIRYDNVEQAAATAAAATAAAATAATANGGPAPPATAAGCDSTTEPPHPSPSTSTSTSIPPSTSTSIPPSTSTSTSTSAGNRPHPGSHTQLRPQAAAGDGGVGGVLAIPAADAVAVVALYDKMPRGSDTGAAAWPFKQALTLLYHLSRGSASPLLPYIAHLPGLAPGVPTPRVAMLMYDDAVDELQYGMIVQDVRNQKYWLKHVSSEVLGRLGDEPPAQSVAASPASTSRTSSTSTSTRASSLRAECAAAAAGAAAAGESAGAGGGGGGAAAAGGGGAFGGLAVDAELFGWAVAVAMSRCFGLTRFRTHTCVPLVDMANHTAPYSASNCEIRTGVDGQVSMFTKRPVRAGEELTLTYGSHDNHNLLLSYGFTLQPNPNDAYYFDMDLETVEGLAEGLGGSGGSGVLAPWQRELLDKKLGLRRRAEGEPAAEGGNSDSSSTIRVYLSATVPSAAAAVSAAVEGDGEGGVMTSRVGDDGAASADSSSSTSGRVVVRQPVDPRLLAALRIATLQDEAWYKILSPHGAEQIGAWNNLLARQQEIAVMRLLAALVTALYTTFPTTIQQDRQLLATASVDVAATAAAATLSPLKSDDGLGSDDGAGEPKANSAAGVEGGDGSGSGGGGGWVLRPGGSMVGGSMVGARTSAASAQVAAHSRDMAAAVRFRLGLKTTLEQCLQALVGRAKELDALQTVR